MLRAPLKEIIEGAIKPHPQELKLTEGKKVFEIRPNVNWDKGRAVAKLRQWLGLEKRPFVIYVGDDRTDEDAFRALKDQALTIHVGRSADTAARYRLKNVADVWRFLRTLQAVLACIDLAPRIT